MTTSTAVEFRLPAGWTLRKVAAALAREWLPPFLAETGPKSPRWVLQPVVEAPESGAPPLWQAGISTAEYEERLDHADLAWVIRASVARGRGKGNVLARLRLSQEQPNTFQLTVMQAAVPDTLLDTKRVSEYLGSADASGLEGLFVGLLNQEGIEQVS